MRVRLPFKVTSEPWWARDRIDADSGEHPAGMNQHGAVWVILPDGRHLGVKPDEYEVVEATHDELRLLPEVVQRRWQVRELEIDNDRLLTALRACHKAAANGEAGDAEAEAAYALGIDVPHRCSGGPMMPCPGCGK